MHQRQEEKNSDYRSRNITIQENISTFKDANTSIEVIEDIYFIVTSFGTSANPISTSRMMRFYDLEIEFSKIIERLITTANNVNLIQFIKKLISYNELYCSAMFTAEGASVGVCGFPDKSVWDALGKQRIELNELRNKLYTQQVIMKGNEVKSELSTPQLSIEAKELSEKSSLRKSIDALLLFSEKDAISDPIDYLSKLKFANLTVEMAEYARKEILKIYNNKKNSEDMYLIFYTLLVLAQLYPINDEDSFTLEAIDPIDRVCVSTGHQFNLSTLIQYHNTRDYRGSLLSELANSKFLLNPITNSPLDLRDVINVLAKFESENAVKIDNLKVNNLELSKLMYPISLITYDMFKVEILRNKILNDTSEKYKIWCEQLARGAEIANTVCPLLNFSLFSRSSNSTIRAIQEYEDVNPDRLNEWLRLNKWN